MLERDFKMCMTGNLKIFPDKIEMLLLAYIYIWFMKHVCGKRFLLYLHYEQG